MNSTYELPNPDRCFRERPADQPERRELQSALRWIIGGFIRWRRRRAAIRELRVLNDHYLADIGRERVQVVSNLEEMIRQVPSEIADGKSHSGIQRT